MKSKDVLIIGAGISGLLCATELKKSGRSVCLLDKGRGLGGRMATRRMAGGRLDHGAQFFTVRDQPFQAYVDQWLKAGIIKEWFRHLPGDRREEGYSRYCGIHGMTDVPKYLAQDLEVRNLEQVIELSREGDLWIACSASGSVFIGRHLVLTAPLPQALSLLKTTGLNFENGNEEQLWAVRYERGLAALVILNGPSGLADGKLKVEKSPLAWVADNQQKGISPDTSAITIHAAPDFAETYWDSPDEIRGPLLLEAAKPYLDAEVLEYACHRWGFTLPVNPLPEPFFQNVGLKLTLAGDAFGGPRIEGAALSGIEAARSILAL